QLMRPSIIFGKLILAVAPLAHRIANGLRDPWMIGKGPHEAPLIQEVIRENAIPVRVAPFGPAIVHANIVGGESKIVIHIRLTVGHERGAPRRSNLSSLKIAKEQFIAEWIVADRLFEWLAIFRRVGQTHPKIVGLD